MRRFLLNILLAVSWCILTGSASAWNFLAGMLVGGLVVSSYSNVSGQGPYFRRVFRLLRFGLYFASILVRANVQIAILILSPRFSHRPRILRYPVCHLTMVQTTTLANAITLTPGTLAVDISPDGKWLYLHCMYAENPTRQLAEIDELERKLMKAVFS